MTETPGGGGGGGASTFVGPGAAAARMAALGALPGMTERVAAIRGAMDAADQVAVEEREQPGGDD